MKTRILAFVALVVIALAWHLVLVQHKPEGFSAPPAEASQALEVPDKREPASTPSESKTPGAKFRLEDVNHELKRLKECLDSESCSFPQTDSRSYELAVSQAAVDALSRFTQNVRAEKLQDEAVLQFALESFQWSNDSVRSAALDLISTQKPSPACVVMLLSGLRSSHDSSVYHKSLKELVKYQERDEREVIEQFLLDTIENGSFGSAAAVSAELLPFLSPQNVERFRKLASSLNPTTQRAKYLSQALREFDAR